MYAEQRHKEILDALNDVGRVAVSGLAERFGVTAETIRRDLDTLAERNMLVRVHGGAVAKRTTVVEPDLRSKLHINTGVKQKIARFTADYVAQTPTASILVDAGSTTGALIPYLPEECAHIVTNGLAIAQASIERGFVVEILPGKVRPNTGAAVGAVTVDRLTTLKPDMAIIGCNGFDEAGFTTPDIEEAEVKRAMARQAAFTIVVTDSTKAGLSQLHVFARLSDIDVVITDAALPQRYATLLENNGIEVIRA
ncbi:DeoR/GlpR transcriptional regulator [Arcanobacterium haemolyticum]|nr:DeoR/GlpR transcriptional regulator [Arcanobacterium haemolyticum]